MRSSVLGEAKDKQASIGYCAVRALVKKWSFLVRSKKGRGGKEISRHGRIRRNSKLQSSQIWLGRHKVCIAKIVLSKILSTKFSLS